MSEHSIDDQITAHHAWRDNLNAWRKQLCHELLSLPKYARERHEMERQQNLEMSIDSIDRGLHRLPGSQVFTLTSLRLGELMIESGMVPDPTNDQLRMFGGLRWRGCLKDVEREIKALTNAQKQSPP